MDIMTRKQNVIRKGKDDLLLTREESDELQMILDRLAVQDPEGQSFEGYLHSLLNSLSGRPLIAAALIDKLSRNPGLTGFRTFQTLKKAVETSPYKRSLKQAAYRFSQKGFRAAEELSEPRKVVLIQSEARKPTAHLFLVQGTMWIVSALVPEASQGGYILITAFLEDNFDTLNVRIAESGTQKLYKEYLQVLSTHSVSRKGFEIPLTHAARLFFDMLDFWTGKNPHAEIERARELFKKWHEPDKKPYVYELMPEIEHPEQNMADFDVEELLRDMDLSWLFFRKDELSPYHERMKTLDSPILVVPKEIQAERSRDVLHDAAESLCVGAKRRLYTRFFEEQAMGFKLSGAEDRARRAWVIACDLAGESPVGKNPVVFQIVMLSIEFHWPDDFKAVKQTEAAPEHERRTESGIILP
jgi:hypothetical protein